MLKLCFTKYEGAGNDFLLVDDRQATFALSKEEISRLCHRKFGVGADGIILLQSEKPPADFRMRLFNSDGSEAESCGNGLCCLVRFLAELGLPSKSYAIATGNRIVFAQERGDGACADMGAPCALSLHLETEEGIVHFVDTGVPHAVSFVSDLASLDLAAKGPKLRHHPLFQPQGANVNFALRRQPNVFQVRTFERGVEGETLACGTGAVAVAAIARALFPPQESYRLLFAGGELEVQERDGHFWMTGPAQRVFRGSVS